MSYTDVLMVASVVMMIYCLIGIVKSIFFSKGNAQSPIIDTYISEIERMRRIIKIWITNEKMLTKFIVESVSANADMLSNLKDINYKSIGLLPSSDTFLKNLLRDTNELRSYSRFLDLYRKLRQEIDDVVLDTYISRYFSCFTSDCIGEYKHSKKDMEKMMTTFPYLWLLEEIANLLVEIEGISPADIVETDMSKKLHTKKQFTAQDSQI